MIQLPRALAGFGIIAPATFPISFGLIMVITFQSQGGIGFFPRLNRPLTIDTTSLAFVERSELEGLVQTTRFFSLPSVIGTRRPGAGDIREYTITIEDEKRRHTVRAIEPLENPDLAHLIAALASRLRSHSGAAP